MPYWVGLDITVPSHVQGMHTGTKPKENNGQGLLAIVAFMYSNFPSFPPISSRLPMRWCVKIVQPATTDQGCWASGRRRLNLSFSSGVLPTANNHARLAHTHTPRRAFLFISLCVFIYGTLFVLVFFIPLLPCVLWFVLAHCLCCCWSGLFLLPL